MTEIAVSPFNSEHKNIYKKRKKEKEYHTEN